MNTRSKTRQLLQELEFVFDFDNASECWKANKKSTGNGCYTYICGAVLKTGGGGGGGGVCQRSPMKCSDFCSLHSKKNKNSKT
jgi:hypothetical protein